MALPDEHTGVVNTLCEVGLEHLSLQPTLQEILDLQCQHVIKPHASLVEDTNPDKTTDEGITLEKSLRVFVFELEKLTSSTTNFRKDETDTPDFTFVAKAVLASKLELSVETGRLEWSTRDLVAG